MVRTEISPTRLRYKAREWIKEPCVGLRLLEGDGRKRREGKDRRWPKGVVNSLSQFGNPARSWKNVGLLISDFGFELDTTVWSNSGSANCYSEFLEISKFEFRNSSTPVGFATPAHTECAFIA